MNTTATTVNLAALDLRLLDGEERHAENPDTFDLPPLILRRRLIPGDIVKVGIETEDHGGERLWCIVLDRFAEHDGTVTYTVTLDNSPVFLPLDHGDRIEVTSAHVIDILFPEHSQNGTSS